VYIQHGGVFYVQLSDVTACIAVYSNDRICQFVLVYHQTDDAYQLAPVVYYLPLVFCARRALRGFGETVRERSAVSPSCSGQPPS